MDRTEYSKKYRDLNKEEIKEYKKKWYQNNRDKVKNKSKQYYESNRLSILEKRKLYLIEKYGTDMNYRIKKNVLNYIEKGLSLGCWSTEMDTLLGYTVDELRNHLLSFNSIEEWHIHHIIPVRIYNFYSKEDIKKCWSLVNLVPLWNKKRNNNIDWDLIEDRNLEYLLPDTLLIDDMIGRHHEI